MTSNKSDVAIQVKKEHECLKRDMEDITRELKRESSGEDFKEWQQEFTWRLRDFRAHLQRHFELEEEGGFMSEIIRETPEAINKVKELEAEHRQFEKDLDGIIALLKEMQLMDHTRIQELKSKIRRLCVVLRRHEAAENELMQACFWMDIGYPSL